MRKIIASEFMPIDGVIENEEADGDGFKYGGWFFPNADEVTGAVARAASKARRSAVRTQDLRRIGNVLADPFELLAERPDRNEVRRLEYAGLKRDKTAARLDGSLGKIKSVF